MALVRSILAFGFALIFLHASGVYAQDCSFSDIPLREAFKADTKQVIECMKKGMDPPEHWLPPKELGSGTVGERGVNSTFVGQYSPEEAPGSQEGANASGNGNTIPGALLAGGVAAALGALGTEFSGQVDSEEIPMPTDDDCGMKGDVLPVQDRWLPREFECGGAVTGMMDINYLMAKNPEMLALIDQGSYVMRVYELYKNILFPFQNRYRHVEDVPLARHYCHFVLRSDLDRTSDDNGDGVITADEQGIHDHCPYSYDGRIRDGEYIHGSYTPDRDEWDCFNITEFDLNYVKQELTFPKGRMDVPIEFDWPTNHPGNGPDYDPRFDFGFFGVRGGQNGLDVVIGETCDARPDIINPDGYPNNFPAIKLKPEYDPACYKRYQYPRQGICEGRVLHINADEITTAYPPRAEATSYPVDREPFVMMESDDFAQLYLPPLSLLEVGYGQTLHFPHGVIINVPNDSPNEDGTVDFEREIMAYGPAVISSTAGGIVTIGGGGMLRGRGGEILMEFEPGDQVQFNTDYGPMQMRPTEGFIYSPKAMMMAMPDDDKYRAAHAHNEELQDAVQQISP